MKKSSPCFHSACLIALATPPMATAVTAAAPPNCATGHVAYGFAAISSPVLRAPSPAAVAGGGGRGGALPRPYGEANGAGQSRCVHISLRSATRSAPADWFPKRSRHHAADRRAGARGEDPRLLRSVTIPTEVGRPAHPQCQAARWRIRADDAHLGRRARVRTLASEHRPHDRIRQGVTRRLKPRHAEYFVSISWTKVEVRRGRDGAEDSHRRRTFHRARGRQGRHRTRSRASSSTFRSTRTDRKPAQSSLPVRRVCPSRQRSRVSRRSRCARIAHSVTSAFRVLVAPCRTSRGGPPTTWCGQCPTCSMARRKCWLAIPHELCGRRRCG